MILGDTKDSSEMAEDAENCDYLIHEVTFDNSLVEVAQRAYHSTSNMAGSYARLVNAQNLIITHFSARYHQYAELGVDTLVEETKESCPGINVVAAEDFMEIKINPKK